MISPKLDDRSAAEVLAQASALAKSVYLSGLWKGYDDPADPAYQLLRVFSRLMEILIDRLNRVPDKNFLAFLDMVGVERFPGAPASVPVTFLPSAKAPEGGLIPAGTQVATTQTDQIDAQVFETRQAIYATAAKLIAIVNLLPGADRFSIIPPPALPPTLSMPGTPLPEWVILAGTAQELADIPHVLYLGSAALFGRKETLDVALVFTIASGDASLLNDANLVWKKFDKDRKAWVDVGLTYLPAPLGQVKIVLSAFGNNEKTIIAGQEDFWVACHFVGSFTPGVALPRLATIQGSLAPAEAALSAEDPPEKAFANAMLVDLSRPWKPFGERPHYGDTLYLMSQRAFAPEVDQVTVTMTLKPYTTSDLQKVFASIASTTTVTTLVAWQYLAANGAWKPLTIFQHTLTATPGKPPAIDRQILRDGATTTEDGTFFGQPATTQASFTVTLPADLATGKVLGEEGLWIRALLKSDDPYGHDAFIASANPLTVVGSTLIPPVVESAKLAFTYKSMLQDVARVVTENNLRWFDHRQGAAAPAFPLQPFVSPLEQELPSSRTPAFMGGNALYLGFDRPFGDVYISAYFKLRDTFPSVTAPAEQGQPLVTWEYLAASPVWKPLDIQDDTANLTHSGTVSFLGPSDTAPAELFKADSLAPGSLIWFRARLAAGAYDYPPALQGIYSNTVLADNRFSFRKDNLALAEVVIGSGNGESNQRMTLLKTPVLAGELWVREPEPPPQAELDDLAAELKVTSSDVLDFRTPAAGVREAWIRWRRVPNFLGSGPRSRHYTLDALSGELRLGDGQQGMLAPIAKDNLVLRDYRIGGGEAAVQAAVPLAVKALKSSLPYVEKVFNVEGATGGSNPWTSDDLFMLGPQSIKNKGRAVSVEDFEWMVLERFSGVARAKCLSARAPGPSGLVFKPGAVTVIVVPKGQEPVPRPSAALLRRIADFLAEQCLGNIVSDIHALGPGFTEVTVRAEVHAKNLRETSEVERRAAKALEDFFHPLTGGEDRQGWAFGRDVQLSEVYAVLQRVEGVDYVASAEFLDAPGMSALDIGENNLVNSGSHRIEMI